MKIYIDGEKVAENNVFDIGRNMTPSDNLAHNPSLNWYIGRFSEYDVYPEVGPLYYKGLIDEVRIYNRALSSEEIKQLYGEFNPK